MELVLSMYNVHTYFPLKILGKKVHIIHNKIQYTETYKTLKKLKKALNKWRDIPCS